MRFVRSLPASLLILTACSGAPPSDGTGAGSTGAGAGSSSSSGATGGGATTGSTSSSSSGEVGTGGTSGTGGAVGTGGSGGAGGDVTDAGGPTLTRLALLANNTSASLLFTDEYTPGARWNVPNPTIVHNGDAPASATPTADMAHGLVSKVPMWKLLYPDATTKPATKLFAETQGWFCTNGAKPLSPLASGDQCGGHIDIGYDSNAVAHAQAEVADMMSRGFDGAILDWSGTAAAGTSAHSTNVHAINNGNLTNVMIAAEATHGRFEFAAVEDEGMQACAGQTGCDVTTQVIADVMFLAKNYFPSSAYQTIDGRPVVYFFGVDHAASDNGKTIDWTAVRAGVTYTPAPVFVFEDASGFSHAESGGAYGWVKPTPIAGYPSAADPFDTIDYLPGFYAGAKTALKSNPSLFVLGSVFKGFDDVVVNGWVNWAKGGNGNRYLGQQCGKTWIDSFAAAAKAFPLSSPVQALQVPTWDDYEEASEIETGIENYADVTATVSGSALSWSVAASSSAPADCTKALAGGFTLDQTIDHFEVYASAAPGSDSAPLTLVAGDVPATSTSLDLTGKLPGGAHVVYVYAVGKPSIHNHLSAPVPFG